MWDKLYGPKWYHVESKDFEAAGYELLHEGTFLLKGYILPRSFFGFGGPRNQKMYFYYEVYDPSTTGATAPDVQSSLTFYRKKVKVFETPMVTRIQEDVANRHAAVFQLEVPADQFTPGLYTCQINIIDAAAGRFAFPRLAFYVR